METFLDPLTGGSTTVYSASNQTVSIAMRGQESISIIGTELMIELTRGSQVGMPDTFTGTWLLNSETGPITGEMSGEALFSGTKWTLRGKSSLNSDGLFNQSGFGGFQAEWVVNSGTAFDDQISWRVDSFLDK
jgi:hypothetical protein